MDKKQDSKHAGQGVFIRRFLVSDLPEDVSKSGPHIQIFDNYIVDTDLHLRKARNPADDERRFCIKKPGIAFERPSIEIELTKEEYEAFDGFRGRETRFNRYDSESVVGSATIDIFLGELWGINILTVRLDSKEDARDFEVPSDVIAEITEDEYFEGKRLVERNLDQVRDHLAQKKGDPKAS
ncbi:MAG: hypothetical protein HKN33_03935 [Pyrinomonadaceae bacterium]|nr:hypothetical protein [Pyrinomonadaceae bacterium]